MHFQENIDFSSTESTKDLGRKCQMHCLIFPPPHKELPSIGEKQVPIYLKAAFNLIFITSQNHLFAEFQCFFAPKHQYSRFCDDNSDPYARHGCKVFGALET
jgi:hypothetical protein